MPLSIQIIKAVQDLSFAIRAGTFRNIALLTGAGVSVNSGIPDFRSPGGMYSTLNPDLFTATAAQRHAMRIDPTTIVSWDLFRVNSLPYLELRRPFILGTAAKKWLLTISHIFPRLLYERGLLKTLFTQNIDGLEFQSGIPDKNVVAVHGTLGRIVCENCGRSADMDQFQKSVREQIRDIYGSVSDDSSEEAPPKASTPIICECCKKPTVKPATVLYGRNLPKEFFLAQRALSQQGSPCAKADGEFRRGAAVGPADLLFVIGTSLTVWPAAGLPAHIPREAKCVVVNLHPVQTHDDVAARGVFLQGDCDEVLLELVVQLGWLKDLQKHELLLCEHSRALLSRALEGAGQ